MKPTLLHQVNLIKMMDVLPDLTESTIFPLMESSWLEFKESLSKCIQVKIRDTICAFLNSGGGYVVVGVRDIDRAIVGIDSDKLADTFQLRVDDIYHQALILKGDGSPLAIGTVTVATVPAANGKKLLIATIRPEPGETYRMRDGTIWYRLNASNYRLTSDTVLLTQEQVDVMIKNAVREAVKEKQKEIDIFRNKFHELHKDYKEVIGVAKELDVKANHLNKEFEEIRSNLFDTILEKKAEVEGGLEQRWWKRILCCI